MSKRAFLAAAIGLALAWSAVGAAAEDAPLPKDHEAFPYSEDGADGCLKCHDADRKVPVMEIFSTPHANRADLGTPFADKQCESCHGAGGEHGKRLRRNEVRAPLFAFDKGDGAPAIDAKCQSCHDDGHTSDWQGGAHERAGVSCVSCHDSHARRDPMLDPLTQNQTCVGCHKKQLAESRQVSAHPTREGDMACTACHAPHAAKSAEMLLAKNTTNELCYDCHAEKRGPYLWEHAPATEDCSTCHKPHGSNHAALLTRSAPLLCQSCHSAAGHPSVAYTSGSLAGTTPSAMALGRSCMNCHSQVHGSNHPSGAQLSR
jgi:DmsE family decaheme c-type cytochrome